MPATDDLKHLIERVRQIEQLQLYQLRGAEMGPPKPEVAASGPMQTPQGCPFSALSINF